MPAPSRLRALPVWGALCLLAVGPGCERRGVMALPTTPAAEAVRAPPPGHAEVPAAVGRVRALESACRRAQRLQTQGAAARTMDRVRMVLGAFCDVETVGGDPLHWQLRCRANAFFALGQYVPISGADATPPCPALRNAPVDRWTCAGALLHEFVSDAGRVELAAVGHVDHVPLAATARFDGCPALREAMGFNPAEPWYRSVPDAPPPPEAERARGNAQLAWCRAAQTARAVRCGMTLADRGGPVPAEACDALPAATLFPADARATTTALGAGTAWMDAQAPGSCLPGPPVNGVALPGDCPAARRVDLFVRLVPGSDAQEAACPEAERDAAGALACWQRCLEHAAIDVQGERPTETALVAPCGPATALPDGWIRAPEPSPGPGCRSADLARIRSTLGLP
jgi:hypothetical protein